MSISPDHMVKTLFSLPTTGIPPSCYLKTICKPKGMYKTAKVVFCIHNIAYQGRFAFRDFALLNLPDELKSSFDFIDGYDKPVKGRKTNWMKAGILESDRVLTVSPYYAKELVSGEDKGVELDSILAKTGITGIVNGMDVQEWNPSTDKYTSVNFDASTGTGKKPMEKQLEQLASYMLCAMEQYDFPTKVSLIGKLILFDIVQLLYTCKFRLSPQLVGWSTLSKKVLQDFRWEALMLNVKLSILTSVGKTVKRALATYDTPALAEMIQNCMAQDLSWKCEAVYPADVTSVAKTVKRALATYDTPAWHKIFLGKGLLRGGRRCY